MEPIYMILIVVGMAAAVFLGIYIVMPIAIKKGLNVSKVLNTTNTVLNTVDTAIDGVQLLLPDNKALEVVDKIIGYAQKATEAAEQMYKASQIQADERNETAIGIVYECLAVAGIEKTPKIEKVVVGMIEAGVYALPKTNKKD